MSARKRLQNGKPVSTLIGRHLKGEIKQPSPKLKRLLASVYNRYQKLDDPVANATARRDFVFHMSDWIDDLERLAALYADPESHDKKAAGDVVYGFLIHALAHLMAAGHILEGKLSDPFGVLEKK